MPHNEFAAEKEVNQPDTHPEAITGRNINSGVSGVNGEHERTGEVPAVMRVNGGEPVGKGQNLPAGTSQTNLFLQPSVNSPSPLLDPPSLGVSPAYVHIRSCNNEVLSGTRIMGYGKLRNLLQPKHKYFEDKWAEIKEWRRYLDKATSSDLLYPKVKTHHRENPYRRYQLNQQCASRAAKSLLYLIESYRLNAFRVVDLEITMPKAVSVYLAEKGKSGRDMAWGCEDRFMQALVSADLIPDGLARRSNLHTWSTEYPLQPHFHHHTLLTNYHQMGIENDIRDTGVKFFIIPEYPCSKCGGTEWAQMGIVAWQCNTCFPAERVLKSERPTLKRWEWKRLKTGGLVPWNEKNLKQLKAIWLNTVINFVRQHSIGGAWEKQYKLMRFQRRYGVRGLTRLISFMGRFDQGLIDVYVSYASLNTPIGRAKLVNKLAYNGRHPIEDFAVFSNKHTDCDMPPDFIQHYDNKARLFGWWRDIKKLAALPKEREIVKLSPYDAEPMDYLGQYHTADLLEDMSGRLVAVDIIRGRPIERYLSDDDVYWLKTVDLQSWLLFG